MRKLFVGSLDISVTEDDLKEYFGDFGEIEDTTIHRYINIIYHRYINSNLLLMLFVNRFPDSGKSRGFGFVTFTSSSGVDSVQSQRPHQLQGKKIDTKRNLPKTDYGSEDARLK